MFQNPEVALDDLPGTDDLNWESLDPSFAKAIRIRVAVFFAVLAVAATILTLILNLPVALSVAIFSVLAIAMVLRLIWPSWSLPRCGYVVRERDIVFRKGVVWQSVTAVPFNRIQHVETSSTPLDRKFDLATLQLFTSGGSGGDLKIDGLGADVAETLRVYVLDKAGSAIERS
ncbi:MAG: PH domain-containing protein [Woeseiaceae bacterium]